MSGAAALVLVDLQKAIDDPSWGVRNHPHAEKCAVRMLTLWRHLGWPLFHIRHDSKEPNSTYRPGQPGHAFKPETAPLPDEMVLGKTTCSAFASTDLETRLRIVNATRVFVCGVITNNSVEATVRAGGDLGFSMYLVEDACFTFGKGRFKAQDVHEMSLANLDGEYATVTNSANVVTGFLESLYMAPDAAACRDYSLRAAQAARQSNAGDATVLAALLMDIGRLDPQADVASHAKRGGELLRGLGFGGTVCTLVEQHCQTLRYLAARDGARQTLNREDQWLVEALGGPMSTVEAEVFGDRSHSFPLLKLRHCEEMARQPGPPPPGFSTYRPMLKAHLSGVPSQQG